MAEVVPPILSAEDFVHADEYEIAASHEALRARVEELTAALTAPCLNPIPSISGKTLFRCKCCRARAVLSQENPERTP